jgi:hypothetical protein
MEEKNIKSMSVQELKALAYDQIKILYHPQITQAKNNLSIIEDELNRREKEGIK